MSSPDRPRPHPPADDGTLSIDPPRSEPAELPASQGSDLAAAVHAYASLSTLVFGEQPLNEVLHRIAELGKQTIRGADEVSMTLITGGEASTVAFTGDLAVALDERQYEDGFGPCMDAAKTGRTIWIEDTGSAVVYQGFAAQAVRQGIRQTLSVGMPTRGSVAGAINVYSTESAGRFDRTSRDVATTFAGYAAIALLNAASYAAATAEVAQLREAMRSRAEIEQAKGIIMRDRGCSADEAFTQLRDLSSRTHRKVRDLARDVIAQATG